MGHGLTLKRQAPPPPGPGEGRAVPRETQPEGAFFFSAQVASGIPSANLEICREP